MPDVTLFSLRQLTVDQYLAMARHGILTKDDRVELLDGWIVNKMTIHPPHSFAVCSLQDLFSFLPQRDWSLRIQQSIVLPTSVPEPDVAIAVGARTLYMDRHPGPKDLPLVIEVADSSLAADQTVKLGIYAGAKLPQYWIVNLIDRRVEVYTEPRGGKNPLYRKRVDYGPDGVVPVALFGQEFGSIPVREILPR
ncbi:hypothetical protein FRUB_07114 [Fimbriiglobus ruber]|uniref:Putative restriction endonuclease domain-containing protein n=1 Tax=Fimbriiglobus ruber TaxID=1908690 RepID=A0A225DEC1_9BACT|nr:hypothetical protein FRUB_07114 [Fimbriiglobus ruber]